MNFGSGKQMRNNRERDLELEYLAYYWQFLTPWQRKVFAWRVRLYAFRARARRWLESIGL